MDFHERETTSEMEVPWTTYKFGIYSELIKWFQVQKTLRRFKSPSSTESTFIVVALIVVVVGFFVVALVVCALFGFFVVVGFFVAFVVFLVAFVVTALIVVVEGALVVIGVVFSGALVLVLGLTVVYYETSL